MQEKCLVQAVKYLVVGVLLRKGIKGHVDTLDLDFFIYLSVCIDVVWYVSIIFYISGCCILHSMPDVGFKYGR